MDASSIVPMFLVLFLSSFTRSALGFGDALVAMPLLAMILGMRTATPLVALVGSTTGVVILLRTWRSIDLASGWRLVVSSLAGIPVGLLVLSAAPESIIKAILGILLAAFGLFSLFRPRLPQVAGENLSYLFGFAAGVLGGAYNTSGPPVVIYGLLRRWTPDVFRATLQGYFLLSGGAILVAHALDGLWTPEVVELYLWALPALAAGLVVGGMVNKRVTGGQFNGIVYAALVVMGTVLVASAF